jgi:glycosyltransferase involved in cell wall biosynthesis
MEPIPKMAEHLDISHSVCVISHDVIGRTMAGPGIRYLQMARILSEYHNVTLAVPKSSTLEECDWPFHLVQYSNWETLEPHLQSQDVVVFPGDLAYEFPHLPELDAALVVDGYDPLLAEWLALSTSYSDEEQLAWWPDRMHQITPQYLVGDFFLCATERQRDWWLGLLEANGRLNPKTYCTDPSLRSLIDVVPFGLPETDPQWTGHVIKGQWPGIHLTDKVILWGGGLWPWLDPLTAVHAVAEISQIRQDVKLVFPGTRHPNPTMREMPSQLEAAQKLAADLGITDKFVFFGDWIPYADWPNALIESDIALTLHFDTLETRLAFRSRILDYIWAGIPTVATRGDETSNIVAHYNIGQVVDYQDSAGVAAAILSLLEQEDDTPPLRDFASARRKLSWRSAIEPLLQFCANPRRAPDRQHGATNPGNPFYLARYNRLIEENQILLETVDTLNQEVDRLTQSQSHSSALVQSYENGRFIRLMRWFNRLKP